MRLSKAQSKLHQQAMELIDSDRALSEDEREFVFENYQESTGQLNSLAGAFFTPAGLARDFSTEVPQCETLIDLCAGIGALSYASRHKARRIICVEQCADYVRVGKRLLPEAEWIEADVFGDWVAGRQPFDVAISNPPFGAIKASSYAGPYRGAAFEYKIIELASRISRYGAFILPQLSAPFRYSGRHDYLEERGEKCQAFEEQTGIEMMANCGIDTAIYLQDWHGVSPLCEVVTCEFERDEPATVEADQLDLFAA